MTADSEKRVTMGEAGKELLRERIKNKRASEGLPDIDEVDLFAKKPRYELSDEERQKRDERRERNKEAAEKSRKKKKDAFEKIQNENDQLVQNKYKMVAVIDTLKEYMIRLRTENQGLRLQVDQLKRWIGKRASQLGLNKPHIHKEEVQNKESKEKTPGRESFGNPLLRSDQFLHDSENEVVCDSEEQLVRTDSPASSPRHRSVSPTPPPSLNFRPVDIRTAPRPVQLDIPMIVDQSVAACTTTAKEDTDDQEKEVIVTGVSSTPQSVAEQIVTLQESQSVPQASIEEQQLIYLPKDTILIVRDQDGQHVLAEAPPVQQTAMTSVPQVQHIALAVPQVQQTLVSPSSAAVTIIQGITNEPHSSDGIAARESSADVKDVGADSDATVLVRDSSAVLSAIEHLSKLGYKIQKPSSTEPERASNATLTPAAYEDHTYETSRSF